MVPAGWDLPPAVFNLEISQSGSYVPHGILNRVILTRMVWVKLRYWKFEQLLSSKLSWASPFLSCRPSSCFSCSTAILFCIRKRTNSTNEAWIDQQKNICRALKCTLQSLSILCDLRHDTKATQKHKVWNDSHFACLLQASKHTFFIFNIDCCFGSTCINYMR